MCGDGQQEEYGATHGSEFIVAESARRQPFHVTVTPCRGAQGVRGAIQGLGEHLALGHGGEEPSYPGSLSEAGEM